MSWVKLVERNDWESITVHLGGPLRGGKFNTNLDLKDCPPVMKAGKYRVKWSDGVEEVLQVVMRPYSATVYDMGHEYETGGKKPYFIIKDQHDNKHEIYAPELNVKVWRPE